MIAGDVRKGLPVVIALARQRARHHQRSGPRDRERVQDQHGGEALRLTDDRGDRGQRIHDRHHGEWQHENHMLSATAGLIVPDHSRHRQVRADTAAAPVPRNGVRAIISALNDAWDALAAALPDSRRRGR